MRSVLARCVGAVILACTSWVGAAELGSASQAFDGVVRTEREFAAAAQQVGIRDAFLRYIADDGILFRQGPVAGKPALEADPDDRSVSLNWWPAFVGVAQSGDLAFSTGPHASSRRSEDGQTISRQGQFLTIWGRQPDGGWRFLLDMGTPKGAGSPEVPVQVIRMPDIGKVAALKPKTALAQVRRAEARLAASDRPADFLEAHARVLRPDMEPMSRETAASMMIDAPRATLSMIAGKASAAGDLACTYGVASWVENGAPRRANYVHVWRRGPKGWQLILDQRSAPIRS